MNLNNYPGKPNPTPSHDPTTPTPTPKPEDKPSEGGQVFAQHYLGEGERAGKFQTQHRLLLPLRRLPVPVMVRLQGIRGGVGEFCVVRLLGMGGGALGTAQRGGDHAPFGRAAGSGLVAAPAHIRPAHADHRVWLGAADDLVIAFPVVCLGFAVLPSPQAPSPHSRPVKVFIPK